jgi:hypothetical protein
VVVNSRFIENSTGNGANLQQGGGGGGGGGVASSALPTIIVNCAFIGNTTGHGGNSSGGPPNPGGPGGAGAGFAGGSPTIANCTFWENSTGPGGTGTPAGTTGPGGAVSATAGTLSNSIAWANLPEQIAGVISVTYSDLQGGLAGTGNIALDPLFADAPTGDFRLSADSPCIDAGSNGDVPPDSLDLDDNGDTSEPTPIDLAEAPRFHDDLGTTDSGAGTPPIVDMGSFEYQLTSGCPADLDGNGSISLADLAIQLSNFGTAGADPGSGDLDGDGDVDLADLAMMLSRFGTTCA